MGHLCMSSYHRTDFSFVVASGAKQSSESAVQREKTVFCAADAALLDCFAPLAMTKNKQVIHYQKICPVVSF